MAGPQDFEMPSPKRMRLEARSPDIRSDAAIDDMDDIYGTSPASQISPPIVAQHCEQAIEELPSTTSERPLQLPGLGSLHNDLSPSKDHRQTAGYDMRPPELALKSQASEGVAGSRLVEEQPQEDKATEDEMNDSVKPIALNETTSLSILAATEHTVEDVGPPARLFDGPASVQMEEAVLSSELPQAPSNSQSPGDNAMGKAKSESTVIETETKPVTEVLTGASKDVIPFMNDESKKRTSPNLEDFEEPPLGLEMTGHAIPTSEETVEANKPNEEAEFEIDSSPLVSSSSDVSSDTSSSDDDSDAEDYEMLDPVEAARRLMAEDGGSDDDKPGKGGKGISGGPRTTNEKPDEVVPKPNVTITPDMHIEELGQVENLIDNLALIKANTSGEYQVLEAGSVLCLENRSVIGVVAETLGRVQQPYYSVRFTNAAAMVEDGITPQIKIFYVKQFSSTVFTQRLKAYKGSDASNLHDEEIGDDEIDFSDDEAEAEHKRHVKLQRQAKRGGRRDRTEGFSRGPQGPSGGASNGYTRDLPSCPEHLPDSTDPSLNYDDAQENEDDELYTPLARPANLHEMMAGGPPSVENTASLGNGQRGGRDRGGGDRGRAGCGRGNRGRDRGGRGDRRDQGGRGGARGANRGGGKTPHVQSSVDRSSLPIPQNSGFDHSPRPPQGNGYTQQSDQSNGFQIHQPPQQSPMPPPAYQAQAQSQAPSHPSYPTQHPNAYGQSYSQPQQYQNYPSQYPQQYHDPHDYPPQQTSPPNYQVHQPFAYPQYPAQQVPPSPSSIPPGAHINPNFFRQQAQPQLPSANGNTNEQHGNASTPDFARYN